MTGEQPSPPRARIATAADQQFSRSLAQLLMSAVRRGADRRYSWVVYDLGISTATRQKLQSRFPWCDWRTLDFSELPPHYAPKTRSFAWKPLIIWRILQERPEPLLWMDSATIIRGDLDEVFGWITHHGIYLAHGQSAIRDRCEPAVMDRLGFPSDLVAMREGVANFVGFDPGHETALGVARDWERHARDAGLLLPETVTIRRHMNDQAVLNCLVMPKVASGALRLPDVDMDISSPRPIRVVSTRNKLPPWLPLWADMPARAWYGSEKALDRCALRFAAWRENRRRTR